MPTTPAPAAGAAPSAPTPGDSTQSDFLGQLTAAVKTLKGLASAVTGQTAEPSETDGEDLPAPPEDSDASATPSDDVAELLATLGLVLVPPGDTPPLPVDAGSGTQAEPVQLPAAPPQMAVLQQAPDNATAPAASAAAATATTPLMDVAQPSAPTHDTGTPPVDSVATPPRPELPVAQPQVQQQRSDQTPNVAAPQLTIPHASVVATDGSAFQQSAGGDERHSRAVAKPEPVESVEPAPAPLPEHLLAAGATTATEAASAAQAPAETRAADVASQIAQQVDLYKLPGNKGLRIQLHPEDLGGVQVTVKYAPGGNLELHINVEHAATGSLVEAGWSQLRDALATQGFHPDRLVMSVTAPASSAQADFSSNTGSGSYRSDAGLTAFTQDGHSGQQRGNAEQPRAFSSAADPVAPVDDTPRATAAATSRIDYRV
jgi:flagellar hook-length control protein FliK